MPDLLIVSADHTVQTAVEELARSQGLRTKSALDASGALDWMKQIDFDIVCVGHAVELSDQERIAEQLWKAQPVAPFVLVDLTLGGPHQMEARLLGADVARGESALHTLEVIFGRLKPRTTPRFENFRVMVVDDLDSPRDIICSFVETMGFGQVLGCRSAKEALATLTSDPTAFSCVLTDMRMPDISGGQLIEQIRKHPKLLHLPVIVLTAYGSAETLLGCLRAGASGFLVKPPKRADLARELGRAYRIAMRESSPRLASPDEVEMLRSVLERRGFT